MVFGNDEFKKVEIRELYKSQMNGFNDSTLKDYNPMLISSIFKKEFKDSMQEDEFIKSYCRQHRQSCDLSVCGKH